VNVGSLTLTGGAQIDTSSAGAGRGGDIELQARDVELSDGAIISARSTGDGAAGTLGLQVAETFRSESGHVTMAADRADRWAAGPANRQ
jgi:large exoprotein involved in heme utilization and adhesion